MEGDPINVVICSHFSIFETLETTREPVMCISVTVVICSHFSIFETLETTCINKQYNDKVVICSHFSIFETLETTFTNNRYQHYTL